MPDARSGPRPVDPAELVTRPDWARRLHLARIARGWRLADLAEVTGFDVPRLSQYEHGVHRPGLIARSVLNAAFGEDVA